MQRYRISGEICTFAGKIRKIMGIKKLFIIAGIGSAAMACSDDEVPIANPEDFEPLTISFILYGDGEDLLNPASTKNVLQDSLYIVYNGDRFVCDLSAADTTFENDGSGEPEIRYVYNVEGEFYHVFFGSFNPAGEYKGERFALHWGKRRTNEYSFSAFVTWNGDEAVPHYQFSTIPFDGVMQASATVSEVIKK